MRKPALALLAVLISGSALADVVTESGILTCTLHSYYLDINKEFVVDLSDDYVGGAFVDSDGRVMVGWSLTECEDNTDVSFEAKEWADLVSGKEKTIYGMLHHAEPDAMIDATVECSYMTKAQSETSTEESTEDAAL